jgi:hypothetical protein
MKQQVTYNKHYRFTNEVWFSVLYIETACQVLAKACQVLAKACQILAKAW